jgi:hypothetical protein
MRTLLKLSFLLTLAFTGLVGVIRAQPYDDAKLRALLTPPDGCPIPCFMGIRLGVTTFREAVAILNAHPWVARVAVNGTYYQSIHILRWTGRQPDFIDTTRSITLRISRGGRVGEVFIPTTLSAGSVYPLLGEPSAADILPALARSRDSAGWGVLLVYNDKLIRIASAPLSCPMRLASFLNSPVNITIAENRSDLNVTIMQSWDRQLFRDANRLC